jgi:hypothetical protein
VTENGDEHEPRHRFDGGEENGRKIDVVDDDLNGDNDNNNKNNKTTLRSAADRTAARFSWSPQIASSSGRRR